MADKTVHIRFLLGVSEESISKLIATVEEQLKQGLTRLVLLMSSPGGNVFYGLSAYKFLKGVPAEVVTHNFGSLDSMAVVMFCAGSKRLSVPHARFLVHGVSAQFQQQTALEEMQLEERLKALKLDIENIAGVIAANTGRSEEQVIKDMLSRQTLNPEQAMKYGLVHEIKEELFPTGAELISI